MLSHENDWAADVYLREVYNLSSVGDVSDSRLEILPDCDDGCVPPSKVFQNGTTMRYFLKCLIM